MASLLLLDKKNRFILISSTFYLNKTFFLLTKEDEKCRILENVLGINEGTHINTIY
jgi:hypothetical protein